MYVVSTNIISILTLKIYGRVSFHIYGFHLHPVYLIQCSRYLQKGMKFNNIIIPPANFVCGGVYCFHVVRPCVRPSVRP